MTLPSQTRQMNFSSIDEKFMSTPHMKVGDRRRISAVAKPPLHSKSPSMQANRRRWQQSSIVRRPTAYVYMTLESVTAISPFLQAPIPEANRIAYFDRSEIVTGHLVGRGGFSVVYEIVAFDLKESISRTLSPEQQQIREQYASNVTDTSSGQGRFVIKHLQERLFRNKKDFSVAAADMALEAAFLSRMTHTNISTLRGMPVTGFEALEDGRHDGYFLILDRLQETLQERICKWQKEETQDRCSEEKEQLEITKIKYSRQLASALQYLHERRIVFRDLKPHNIGFAADTDQLQLFDFGLCRELPPNEDDGMDATYKMSGVGTKRYMAPEVIRNARYNCKADVYSWAMVTWQMFTLHRPYASYTEDQHEIFVCFGNERPPLIPPDDGEEKKDPHGDMKAAAAIPTYLRGLLEDCWTACVADRCSMSDVTRRLDKILVMREISKVVLPSHTSSRLDIPEGLEANVSVTSDIFDITRTNTTVLMPPIIVEEIEDDEDIELLLTRSFSVPQKPHFDDIFRNKSLDSSFSSCSTSRRPSLAISSSSTSSCDE